MSVDLSSAAPADSATDHRISLPVQGMTCASCSGRLEKSLKRRPGISSASVNLATEQADIHYRPDQASPADIIQAIEATGFSVPIESASFAIQGMTCASCSGRLERVLNKHPLVLDATVNLALEQARISYYQGTLSASEIGAIVEKAGFSATPETSSAEHAEARAAAELAENARDLRKIILCFALTLPLVLDMVFAMAQGGAMLIPPWGQLILATAVQGIAGGRFYKGAWASLRGGTGNMDVLVALGTSAAWGLSVWRTVEFSFAQAAANSPLAHPALYFEASAVVLTLVLLGKWLENRAKRSAASSIRALMSLSPEIAHVERDGAIRDLPVDAVKVGDTVHIRSGERVPVDGAILDGASSLDESLLTGESLPIDKSANDDVIAGSINGDGLLKIKATAVGPEATLGRMVKLIEDAQASRAPIQKLVDRISAVFVPTIVLLAIVTFAGWLVWGMVNGTEALELAIAAAISVLVIACPCALGLATPAAIMVGTGTAARHGILIKDAHTLERARAATTVVFDKTGTLTEGHPEVTGLFKAEQCPWDEDDLVAHLHALETGSEHPLAKAIVRYGAERLNDQQRISFDQVSAFRSLTGRGVSARVKDQTILMGSRTWMRDQNLPLPPSLEARAVEQEKLGRSALWVATQAATSDDSCLAVQAVLCVADPIKAGAKETVAHLHQQGLKTVLLSGDNQRTAQAVADSLGISTVFAEVLPEQKVEVVQKLIAEGEAVAMVGDGVNDAPALAAADISIAMGTGSDVAMETASITVMRGEPGLVADALSVSRATYRKITQNLAWAFGYNVIAIPLAMAGALDPMIAGAAMAFSSVSVLTNSLLLRLWRSGQKTI